MSAQHDNYFEQQAANDRKNFSKERAQHYEQMAYTKDKDTYQETQQDIINNLLIQLD